ncbi:GIY-YIG nuclease family protein [Ectobacillus ponti]|uniref:GIY-YIG nuclease family protein n=1 Tax=Ectobacillus ponti TaxID=2961894 RepID=A0AA41X9I9_9BACI|nr:GIY-YIG nuclease family protein [Ectobacillus ponti]MCP8971197.1 GIY-YIG nuclease family protein [Ectobacillus ponti]
MESKHFFYVAECRDGSWYAGYTTDLERRLAAHNAGKGARYTRSRLPVAIIYAEEFPDKRSAMQAEYRFKQLKRKEKEEYIQRGANYVAAKKLSE